MGSFVENPRIRVNNKAVSVMKFSGGEWQTRLPSSEVGEKAEVVGFIQTPDDLIQLFLTCKSIHWRNRISLILPYFPYSRQDRECYKGEASSASWVAEVIGFFGFDNFATVDIHNPETLEGIDGAYNELPIDAPRDYSPNRVAKTLKGEQFDYVVAPDKGAINRAKEYAAVLNLPLIRAEKTRDPIDGKITGFAVLDPVPSEARLLIADDICDGGGTFVGLAAELKRQGATRVSLMVAHGIFSRGVAALKPEVDEVYFTNSRGQNPELPYYHLFRE